MTKLPKHVTVKNSKLRRAAQYLFSEPRLTVGDTAVACIVMGLLFTGHWLAAIPVGIIGALLSQFADHLSWQ